MCYILQLDLLLDLLNKTAYRKWHFTTSGYMKQRLQLYVSIYYPVSIETRIK